VTQFKYLFLFVFFSIIIFIPFHNYINPHSHSYPHPHSFYQFNSIQQQTQFQHLLNNFRCVVCQDENLASSNAKIAVDLKNKIYLMVTEHKSNRDIKRYLLNRYGNFVLLKPPLIPETYFLWLAPLLMLILGGCVFYFEAMRVQ